jgi:hypothetical protein
MRQMASAMMVSSVRSLFRRTLRNTYLTYFMP